MEKNKGEVCIQTKGVEEMLRDGVDPNILMNKLRDEISDALRKIQREKEEAAEDQTKRANIDALRKATAKNHVDYLLALGMLPEEAAEDIEEVYKDFEQALIQIEQEFKEFQRRKPAIDRVMQKIFSDIAALDDEDEDKEDNETREKKDGAAPKNAKTSGDKPNADEIIKRFLRTL